MYIDSIPQLDLFENRLPEICRCTDELGVTFYRAQTVAKAMRYLDPNQPNSTNCIVHDLDYPDAVLGWMDYSAPPPNMVAINPKNGHAHYFYLLKDPVHWNGDSSRKAQRYAAAVQEALRDQLRADLGYHGPLAKNPLHPDWPVAFFQPEPQSLRDLASHLDLIDKKVLDLRRKAQPTGLGRNCTVFDLTRLWAYAERRKPQGWFGFDFWEDMVIGRARAINATFTAPLGDREVLSIARSIAKWVWENMTYEGFIDWCKRRNKASQRVRKAAALKKWRVVEEMTKQKPDVSNHQLTKWTGFPRASIIRWKAQFSK